MKKVKKVKMTKLEKYVWYNPHASMEQIAAALNRSVREMEKAYDRANRKFKAQIF